MEQECAGRDTNVNEKKAGMYKVKGVRLELIRKLLQEIKLLEGDIGWKRPIIMPRSVPKTSESLVEAQHTEETKG